MTISTAHTRSAPLNESEFERLFTQCARLLWCIAAGVLGDRDRARDVVQDAAIIGLQKRSEFTPGTSFANWMGQIVRFTALNEARKEKLRVARGSDALEALPAGDPQFGPRSNVNLSKVQQGFDDETVAALSTLEEIPRACLLMKTVLDMEYRDISDALGIPEGTAMSHVHRSRQRMRDALLAAKASAKAGGKETP